MKVYTVTFALQSGHMLMFLMVLAVFLISYSVTSQALMNKDGSFYFAVPWDLFIRGIWQVFGELNIDDDYSKFRYSKCANL